MYVLHSSVATQLKCGGIFNNYVIANCPQNAAIKNFENQFICGEDIENKMVGRFLDTVYMCARGISESLQRKS